jgi:hypothetical protein
VRRVYKWPWDPTLGPTRTLPWSTEDRVLLVAEQHGVLTLWAEQEDEGAHDTREFRLIGTGDIKPAGLEHVGSAVVGAYVWHVYAVPVLPPF